MFYGAPPAYPTPQAQAVGTPAYTPENYGDTVLSSYDQPSISAGFGSKDDKTETQEHAEVDLNDLEDVTDIAVIVPESRANKAPMTKSRAEGSTGHASAAPATSAQKTTTSTTFTPPTLPTVPLKKIKWQGLLCTTGATLRSSDMFPEDGLCDYIFYDSVYKRGLTPFDPNHVEDALSVFLGKRPHMYNTTFGIGFAYKYRRELKLQLSANGGATRIMLQYFLGQNICDFGILDTPTNGLDETSLEKMLESLKLLYHSSINQRSNGKSCLTVFAGPAADTTLENIYFEKFSNIFTPNVVIILSHYGQGDNTLQNCHVMPPTVLTRPAALSSSSGYKEDLSTAADTISRLTARGVDASWALSVTMKGRWTVLKAGQPADFLSLCEHDPSAESFGTYLDVCDDSNYDHEFDYNSTIYGTLFRRLSNGQMFSFDNDTMLLEKLCRVKAQYSAVAFGIAAFDVDYEDFLDICSWMNYFGEFTRICTLRDLVDFFVEKFKDPSAMDECLSLD
ncbi:hypothetical protein HPB49_021553 [Dermacentor silvarum]|uniref:Uncharacterized protein n=1 Tax=Dermacentor silvarum TaxID=543639 RepID=A0ACB8CTK2_DERSI|nr:hypothetical protein HPB49_021553 [Dermacentor silvarum]